MFLGIELFDLENDGRSEEILRNGCCVNMKIRVGCPAPT